LPVENTSIPPFDGVEELLAQIGQIRFRQRQLLLHSFHGGRADST